MAIKHDKSLLCSKANSTQTTTASLEGSPPLLDIIDPLVNARDAASLLGISVPTFWRRVADGTVTKPLKLGALSRWPQSEILQVIATAKAARAA